MKPSWLGAISARMTVKGRNLIILSGLGFCAFCTWRFEADFGLHPTLSWVFLAASFALGVAILFVGLVAPPRASEVAEKYFLQQVDKQILLAGGFQSSSEAVDFLRTAREIEYLPPPSGLVDGSAARESDRKDISQAQGEEIAAQDKAGVEEMLRRNVQHILSTVRVASSLPPGQQRRIAEPGPAGAGGNNPTGGGDSQASG